MGDRRAWVLWVVFGVLIALVQIDAMRTAFEALGASPLGAGLLLLGSLLGSRVDVPLVLPEHSRTGTGVAVNVGGCVVPVAFSAWICVHAGLPADLVVPATLFVALVSRLASKVEPGVGVVMPGFVAPLAALAASFVLVPAHPAPLAYVCGTTGVLLGADVTRLRQASARGASMLSIGGAGTQDGIFLAGIVAVLLAM
jgi:uncharacterized membrane protein